MKSVNSPACLVKAATVKVSTELPLVASVTVRVTVTGEFVTGKTTSGMTPLALPPAQVQAYEVMLPSGSLEPLPSREKVTNPSLLVSATVTFGPAWATGSAARASGVAIAMRRSKRMPRYFMVRRG